MTTRVGEGIVSAIEEHGPISFAAFMDLALYGLGGYYESPPVGAAGDFVTNPHVHEVFAQLLGTAIRESHNALGGPSPLRLTEVGAGDGTLARCLLATLGDVPLDYLAVERSSGARAMLAGIDGLHVAATLDDEPHVVLAHELLDNLPFRRVRATHDGPREVSVGFDGNRLVEVLTDPDDDLRADAADLEPGEETVHPDGALAFIDELSKRLTHGYALLIDYGAVGSSGGYPHGYRSHRVVEDMLVEPGTTDITAGVDFALIAARAEARGLTAFPSVTQRHALTALGFERWIRAELERQAKLLQDGDGDGAVRAWTGRSRATLLVDPAALGRHRWLLLATPGLPPPDWLGSPQRELG
jgi:NADH dehydrogenase [ubiquinone] 1 alpha subcomplex assembly factor 7